MFKWFLAHGILVALWLVAGFLTAIWCKICCRWAHKSKHWIFRILWHDYFLFVGDGYDINYYTILWGHGRKKEWFAWIITIITGPFKILLSFFIILAYLCFVMWPDRPNKKTGRVD
ncbi:hypothetical protein HZA71_01595 [Candidatus Falkowbacteria bacterium]|nr:hypothetical protein [Candidatus Falkowbacteria bacterium]